MEKSQFKRTKEEEGMRKPYEEQKIGKLNNYDEEKIQWSTAKHITLIKINWNNVGMRDG